MNVTQHTARRDRRSWLRPMLVWAAAIAITVPLLSVVTPADTATAATALPDGLTSPTAAGSCWEAKQNYPASADGVYWVVTPTLKAPTQVYCDMTTDGGGWALVGRGREGWKNNYNGLRAANVATTPNGTGAFQTAQLAAQTVDGLLNGTAVKDLADGVRLKRATNTTGTTFQEVRFKMTKRDRWVWTFRGEHPVGTYTFTGSPPAAVGSGSGGQTASFGNNTAYRRVDQGISSAQGWVGGFSFGSGVTGTNSATSYLWSNTNGLGGARPFTQVFIRPKLKIAEMNFGTIPDAGAPAQTLREMPESNAITTRWGVTGQANGIDGELNTEVAAFGQVGNTVYVGGNFQYVQRTLNATGANKVERKFLAAFDVNTGEFIPTFQPNLNGQVKAIIGLPDGRLAVGGDFSQVDGSTQQSFVVLNA
ncbi:MAG: fibrinogen-like YCDxxxxGGGW domain-containing protein, partial [Mycetocola sp.]